MESGATGQQRPPVVVINADPFAVLNEKLRYLAELVAAIDRRVPQIQRAAEPSIADAAVRLRTEAVTRIREIERNIADRRSLDRRSAKAE